jgi:hypothetical protein
LTLSFLFLYYHSKNINLGLIKPNFVNDVIKKFLVGGENRQDDARSAIAVKNEILIPHWLRSGDKFLSAHYIAEGFPQINLRGGESRCPFG